MPMVTTLLVVLVVQFLWSGDMAKFAVIENNTVVNVIVADAGFLLDGFVLVELAGDSLVSPGWGYQDGEFIAAPEPEVVPHDVLPTPPSGTIPVTEF